MPYLLSEPKERFGLSRTIKAVVEGVYAGALATSPKPS